MVALIVKTKVDGETVSAYRSGGSLIHLKIVMTAAQKTTGVDLTKLFVRAGDWNIQNDFEPCKHEEQKVKTVVRHERFSQSRLRNNIALLILEDEFALTEFVNTICLPPKGSNLNNLRCFASGWGKNKFGKAGVHQPILKKVEMPIVERDECRKKLKTRLGEDFILNEEFLCAGE